MDYDVDKLPKKNILSMQLNLESFALATPEEKAQIDTLGESTSFLRDGLRKLRKNPLAMGAIIVLVLVLLMIMFAPFVIPYGYDEILTVNGARDIGARNLGPFEFSAAEKAFIASGGQRFPHIFGTDELCRDYFVRVLYGARISLFIGIFSALIVVVIGTLYGAIAGYCGGKVDLIMMRIVDIIYSLPDMLVVIMLSVVLQSTLSFPSGSLFGMLGANMISLFIVFALLYWVSMARLVRARVLSIRKEDYVAAARSMGASPAHIILKHIIPNCLSTIIVAATLEIPGAIFTESYLSFIGLGVQAPMPSLGSLANAARGALISMPQKLFFPALFIVLIVLSLNLLGDGLRDAFDPRSKKG